MAGGPTDGEPATASKSRLFKWCLAAVFALVVGLVRAGGAVLLDLGESNAILIGALGGIGAAVYVFRMTARL